MIFKKLTNLKIFLLFLVTTLFLTLIVYFYSDISGGKTKKIVILKENQNIDLDIAKNLNGFPINIFEKVQLEYFIDNFQSDSKSYRSIIFNLENRYSKKVKCPENLSIIYTKLDNFSYIKADKKKIMMVVSGKTKDIDNINSCILQTVDFINEALKNNYDKALTIYNLYYKKNLIFLNLPQEDKDEVQKLYIENLINLKKLDKNLVEIIYLETLNISKENDIKVLFFTLFLIFLIISLVIFNKKKYLHFIKKIF